MIENLLAKFGSGALHKIAMIVGVGSQVVKTFDQEFAEDKDAKIAAIDSIIELLQKHKEAQ